MSLHGRRIAPAQLPGSPPCTFRRLIRRIRSANRVPDDACALLLLHEHARRVDTEIRLLECVGAHRGDEWLHELGERAMPSADRRACELEAVARRWSDAGSSSSDCLRRSRARARRSRLARVLEEHVALRSNGDPEHRSSSRASFVEALEYLGDVGHVIVRVRPGFDSSTLVRSDLRVHRAAGHAALLRRARSLRLREQAKQPHQGSLVRSQRLLHPLRASARCASHTSSPIRSKASLALPIERGLAGPGMLADTIVKRWQDHHEDLRLALALTSLRHIRASIVASGRSDTFASAGRVSLNG